MEIPLNIHHLPNAILHVDGNAFFAPCEQSRNPALKGKPVITEKERGIASSGCRAMIWRQFDKKNDVFGY